MTTPDPIIEAWHSLFRSAAPEALIQALEAGAVPEPCVAANGNDLLLTVLCRPLSETGSPVFHFGAPLPVGRFQSGREQRQAVLERLLDTLALRSDIGFFEFQDTTTHPAELLASSTPVDLALGWGFTRQALDWLQRSSAPHGQNLLEWNGNLAGQPGTPGRRTQLAVAIHRNQEDIVRWLVSVGVPLNEPDGVGETPLFAANRPEMLSVLLELGADLNAHTCKASPAEHWAKQMRGLSPTDMAPYREMVDTITSLAGTTSATPVIYLQSELVQVQEGYIQEQLDQHCSAWTSKWDALLSSMPAHIRSSHWARQQSSGTWKGEVSALAQVGIFLMEQPSMTLTPALIDLPSLLEGETSALIRKGLPDRGVFALGAMRYFADQELFKRPNRSQSTTAAKAFQQQMVETGAQNLQQAIEKHPMPSWDAWMEEASLTLQRPKNWIVREQVSDMWVHRLRVTQDDGNFGFQASGFLDPGLCLLRLRVAHGLLERGVQLVGNEWIRTCVHWGQALGKAAPGESEEFAQKWLEVVLSTLVDTLTVNQTEISTLGTFFSPKNKRVEDLKQAWERVDMVFASLKDPDFLLTSPFFEKKIRPALPLFMRLQEVPPHLRSLALSVALPEAAPPVKPAPRF